MPNGPLSERSLINNTMDIKKYAWNNLFSDSAYVSSLKSEVLYAPRDIEKRNVFFANEDISFGTNFRIT